MSTVCCLPPLISSLFPSGAVTTSACYATGAGIGTGSSPPTVSAGAQSTFSIYARDSFLNTASDDNLVFGVQLFLMVNGRRTTILPVDSQSFVTDHYEVNYTPKQAGNYTVSSMGRLCSRDEVYHLDPSATMQRGRY